jgi:hypothetical protein
MTAPHGTPETHEGRDPAPDPAHHAADDAGPDEHGGGSLGPIDWPMWGAGVVGVIAAVVVVAAFVVSTRFVFLPVPA